MPQSQSTNRDGRLSDDQWHSDAHYLEPATIRRQSGYGADFADDGSFAYDWIAGRLFLYGVACSGHRLARRINSGGSQFQRQNSRDVPLHSRFLADHDRHSSMDKSRQLSHHPDRIQRTRGWLGGSSDRDGIADSV